jgi:signal transduction histidine kinase
MMANLWAGLGSLALDLRITTRCLGGSPMKKTFVLINLAVAAVLITFVYRQSVTEREQDIEAAYVNLEFITTALQEYTQQTFTALDLNITALATQGFRLGLSTPAALQQMAHVLVNRQGASSNTFSFYILDHTGQLLLASDDTNPTPIDQSAMPEFLVHQAPLTDPTQLLTPLHIGLPRIGTRGAAEGEWVIPVSRRIPTEDGQFAGVAVALLSLKHLVQFYDVIRPAGDGAVGLLNANTEVILRSPFVEEFLGMNIIQTSRFTAPLDAAIGGRVTDFTLNEVPRMSAYRYTWNNQLAVYANTTEASALAGWRQRTASRAGIALLVFALFATISLATVILTTRQRRWTAQNMAAQERALADVTAAKSEIEIVFSSISDAVYRLDNNWCFRYLNAEAEKIVERTSGELIGQCIWDQFPEARGSIIESSFKRAAHENVTSDFETFYAPLGKWFSVRAYPDKTGLTVYFRDISKRKQMEERLRQSYKMDALGQLTGGIAHDFNNLLTVILGNIDELREHLNDKPEHVRSQADLIRVAGERAAQLTHRLLAFARRQPLDPRKTDVDELTSELKALLRRTVRENIEIELAGSIGRWKALVDPHELQNALLNLCLNAQDAMPDGGKLTIETANIDIDSDYADLNELKPGPYVMIAVSDTGHGMSGEMTRKVFDPFFTTKKEGKGSGLGLAMVHGFARQSNGLVSIYSEPGEGTTFRLYLPKADDTDRDIDPRRKFPGSPKGGNERILLVEDDDLVRLYTLTSLRNLGYQVVECSEGKQALDLLRAGETFDLLFTDVVLPGAFSGKQVAEQAHALKPGLKVLFMSGYTENAIDHHGRLDRGVTLLSKPFDLRTLAEKLRMVFES